MTFHYDQSKYRNYHGEWKTRGKPHLTKAGDLWLARGLDRDGMAASAVGATPRDAAKNLHAFIWRRL